MTSAKDAIRNYLTELRRALKGLQEADREEIVSEIEVHLRESIQQPGASIESVISQLGSAKDLAAQYRDAAYIKNAAETISPLRILRAVFRLAKISVLGFVCLLLALVGYFTGGAMVLTAVMKPFLPAQIGLWVGPGVFNFGAHEADRFPGKIGYLSLIHI